MIASEAIDLEFWDSNNMTSFLEFSWHLSCHKWIDVIILGNLILFELKKNLLAYQEVYPSNVPFISSN